MKIAVCGSMTSIRKMLEVESRLKENGHEAILPKFTDEYSHMDDHEKIHSESLRNKIEHDLIRDNFRVVGECDAVLVVNEERRGIPNYIGGNTFLEMAFGHVLNKPIYVLNPLPEIMYSDEIGAMQPIVLNGNIDPINDYEFQRL